MYFVRFFFPQWRWSLLLLLLTLSLSLCRRTRELIGNLIDATHGETRARVICPATLSTSIARRRWRSIFLFPPYWNNAREGRHFEGRLVLSLIMYRSDSLPLPLFFFLFFIRELFISHFLLFPPHNLSIFSNSFLHTHREEEKNEIPVHSLLIIQIFSLAPKRREFRFQMDSIGREGSCKKKRKSLGHFACASGI